MKCYCRGDKPFRCMLSTTIWKEIVDSRGWTLLPGDKQGDKRKQPEVVPEEV